MRDVTGRELSDGVLAQGPAVLKLLHTMAGLVSAKLAVFIAKH